MPGPRRVCLANEAFHVLNRTVARMTIFEKPGNDDAFLCGLGETWAEIPLPIPAFTSMPSRWHFVVRSASDEEVSESIRRLTVPSQNAGVEGDEEESGDESEGSLSAYVSAGNTLPAKYNTETELSREIESSSHTFDFDLTTN